MRIVYTGVTQSHLALLVETASVIGGVVLTDFTSEPYTLQEDMETKDFGTLAAGTVVVDVEYLNPVERARRWFTPPPRPPAAMQVLRAAAPKTPPPPPPSGSEV